MPIPRYRSIAEQLRAEIVSGEASAGGALPTEADLVARYGASRSTVRKALTVLKQEGWLEARQGSGWSVPLSRRGRQLGTFRLKVLGVASDPASPPVDAITTRSAVHDRRRPPIDVAKRLAADRRRRLLVVERSSEAGGLVIHRSQTWFNASLSDTIDPDRAASESPARMLAALGYRLGPLDQYAEAVLSDAEDEVCFDIDERSPVLQIIRTASAIDGTALFQSRHRHPGSSVRLDIDFPASDHPEGFTVGLTPDGRP